MQEIQTADAVDDLKNMKPVAIASLQDVSLEEEPAEDALAEIAAIAPKPTAEDLLPMAGPVPTIRPAESSRTAMAAIASVAPQKPARADADEAPTVLAFAKPDNPMRDMPASPLPKMPNNGSKVAIYDITNGVVHMPNGTRLEAHSGIGKMRDNPKFTHVKMNGPTPPGTYKLTMRESLFHGVAAIRLTPTDGVAPLGRTGLLAHSYLLRVRGDSHGCVAFAEYDKFLAAFRRGEITHMVIVNKHDGKRPGKPRNTLAKLFGGSDA
jgi:hypothetical protein